MFVAGSPRFPQFESTEPFEFNLTILRSLHSLALTYTYDSLNRIHDAKELIGSTEQWKQTFQYDRYGNRTFDELNTTTIQKLCVNGSSQAVVCTADVPIINPTANVANNRLNGATFDNAGNTTKDAQNRKFTYDAENKQIKVETLDPNNPNYPANVTATNGIYFYDGDGKRVKKIGYENNLVKEITIFVYDAGGKLVAEYSTDVGSQQDSKVSYLTNDHLGSPRITTDQNGAVVSRRDFQPFGEEITRASYGTDEVRQKFTGYQRDIESNLDFAKARYHNFNLGRFQSPDIYSTRVLMSNDFSLRLFMVQPQNWNGYSYCRNNPLKYIDSDGQNPLVAALVPGAIGAVVGGIIGGGIEYGRQAYTGEETDWNKIGGAAVQGAIFGAVSAYIGPAGLALRRLPVFASLLGANAVGGIANRAIRGDDPFALGGIIIDAAAGAGGAYLTGIGQTRYFNSYVYQAAEPSLIAQSDAVEVLLSTSPIPSILPTLTRPVIQEAIQNASYNGIREGVYVGIYRGTGKAVTQSIVSSFFNFDIARPVQSAGSKKQNTKKVGSMKADSNCTPRSDGKGLICGPIVID